MANIKTIALSGAETAVYLSGQNCDIRNDGTDIVYASAAAGVTAGADGVLSIPAGGAAKLLDCRGAVYLLGTGSVQLCGNDYSELVFKSAATSSGGGGGEDTVARQAINTHAGNSEIHLTAEKAIEAAATVISNPNQLVNPDFKINQRGKTEYTGSGAYSVDCWRIGNAETKVQPISNGMKLGYISGATTSPALLAEKIENFSDYAGKSLTLSIKIKETTAVRIQVSLNYMANDVRVYHNLYPTEEGVYSVTASVPNNITDLQVWIYGADVRNGDTDDNYTVFEWIKLELGSVATSFAPPDPATELAKCQRYYQTHTTGDISPVDLRPSMRIAPTVTQLDDGSYAYSAEL